MADTTAPAGEFKSKSMDIPVEDLIPFCGIVCFITSCYTDWPECFGCAGKRVCLCCYDELLACKFVEPGDEKWFHLYKGYSYCAPVKVLCMQRMQMCCIDNRCSFPLSEEIPLLVTFCFFTLYFKDKAGPYLFMKSVKDLKTAPLAAP